MCKKWIEAEFEARVKTLNAKKRRKKILKDGIEFLGCTVMASPVAIALYAIAEIVY